MRSLVVGALLALAVLPAAADESDQEKKAREQKEREREEARIERRRELRAGFNSAAKLVAEKFEAFALQPIRAWEGALATVLNEPPAALLDPLRYYLLDDDWEVQAFACYVTGKTGLAKLLPEVEEAYDHARYPVIRRKAVEAATAFALAKVEAARPLLKKGLEDAEPGVRLIAVEGFEWLGDQKALQPATKDKDHDTRYRGLAALARLGNGRAQHDLYEGFGGYVADRAARRRASLVTHDVGERYVRALQRVLKDAQSDARHNAVEALGRIPGPAAVAAIISVLKAERDVPVRLAAVRALARHEEAEAVDGLVRALKDKRYMVRVSAARMLGRRGRAAQPAVRALVKAARDRDYGVREAAVVALARIGSEEGLPGRVFLNRPPRL